MLIIKAWRSPDPPEQDSAAPFVFRVDTYRLQVMPGSASGRLYVAPPRQPILIGAQPGCFARIETYTAAEVLRETVLLERGQLRRIPAPFYKVWIEHLGKLGAREGYEIEAQSAAFDPIRVSGEGFARLTRPDQVVRVAPDAARLVRITTPDGKETTMAYANARVTIS